MKTHVIYLTVIALLVLVVAGLRRGPRPMTVYESRVDTVVVRDTVRETVFAPREVVIVRVDTLWVPAGDALLASGMSPAGDTLSVRDTRVASDSITIAVPLPVERKTYRTDDYMAVVEGFRPSLTALELYPRTTLIDRTVAPLAPRAPPRWAIGIQAGYGISPKGLSPYVGIGIQYNFINFGP